MQGCVDRLNNKVEPILFQAVEEGLLSAATVVKHSNKLACLIEHMEMIFPEKKGKGKKKAPAATQIVFQVEDCEDAKLTKRIKCDYLVFLHDTHHVYLYKDGIIISRFQLKDYDLAVISYISLFYVLDQYYPNSHKIGLEVLQRLVLMDSASTITEQTKERIEKLEKFLE
ncbi:uncharacterized protein [Clytia hemisphaerica]|uniref:Uncharacterized protein n=1 Tax=Clytia hemisphaerica TaxID=252671 RepID=A0A7M5X337_9CNID|eukprot:TCONS_00069771-protein